VDHDRRLLDAFEAPALPQGLSAETRQAELAGELGALDWSATDLVTGSALIDLVSADWIERLADHAAAAGTAIYMSLSYTGTACWLPRLDGDDAVVAAINRHQRQDKGFGRALGPSAHGALAKALSVRGFRICDGASDWSFGPADGAIQRRLIAEWAEAAESLDDPPQGLAAWRDRRLALVERGRFYVGHACLFAVPPDTAGNCPAQA
jgi:hypothetical protein